MSKPHPIRDTPERVVDFYRQGETIAATARHFGCQDQIVKDILSKHGVTLRNDRRHPVHDHVADILSLYEAGESVKSISQRFDASRPIITKILRGNGVSIRKGPESQRLGFARMSSDERAAMTAAAHAAVRGTKRSLDELEARALSKEAKASHASPGEMLMQMWLADRGLDFTLQKAVSKYNLDLAYSPVAVELFGGGWHGYGRHRRRTRERYEKLLSSGWSVIVVWYSNRDCPLSESAADEIVAFFNQASRDPSFIGQYRVIRGDGEIVTSLSSDLDNIANVPSLYPTQRHRK